MDIIIAHFNVMETQFSFSDDCTLMKTEVWIFYYISANRSPKSSTLVLKNREKQDCAHVVSLKSTPPKGADGRVLKF